LKLATACHAQSLFISRKAIEIDHVWITGVIGARTFRELAHDTLESGVSRPGNG